MSPAAPEIPEHQLLRPIASGAYGQVWLARSALGTMRAVKIVRRDRFDRAEDFEREFRGLQRFEPVSRTHEALTDILQIGRQEDWFYYVMELADDVGNPKLETRIAEETQNPKSEVQTTDNGALGSEVSLRSDLGRPPSEFYAPRTLRADLKSRASLPANEVVELGTRLASALAHLHAQGLVHRDVKPSNVLFVKGQPKLADAGLVAAVDDARSLVGTPGYIPPEGPGTAQADIYSLGKVLYEAAFGKDRQDFPQLPADLVTRPDHAALLELNEIIARACAQDPRQRHANPRVLLTELELLQHGHSVKRKRALQNVWAVGKKIAVATGLVAGVLGVASIGALRFLRGDGHQQPKTPGVKKLMDQANAVGANLTRPREAFDLYKQAIALEPDFAPAWLGLFGSIVLQDAMHWNGPADLLQEARAAADKLERLAPDYTETHTARAFLDWLDWRFQDALAEGRQATKKPEMAVDGLESAHTLYGYFLLQSGKPAEALKEYRIAEKLNGGDALIEYQIGHPYFAQGKLDQALTHYEACLKFMPQFRTARYWKARVLEEKKDFKAAIVEFEIWSLASATNTVESKRFWNQLRDAVDQGGETGYWATRLRLAQKDSPVDLYYIATLYARLGDRTNAYAKLRDACAHKAFDQGLMIDLCWDHNDPEFQAIARGIGLLR